MTAEQPQWKWPVPDGWSWLDDNWACGIFAELLDEAEENAVREQGCDKGVSLLISEIPSHVGE